MQSFTAALFACSVFVAGCSQDPSTSEEKTARGDELLRRTSSTLAAAKTITYTTDETIERMTGDKKVARRRSQQVTIRRPDRAHFKITGEGVDKEFWYDGKSVTFASHPEKVWARGPMPATLDQALDDIYTEYGVPVPMADLLYSVPYEAFLVSGSKGGWVGRETVNGNTCHRLSYKNPHSSWDFWVRDDERGLPCGLTITHTEEPGSPVTQITFVNGTLDALVADDVFVAKVDESKYRRLELVRASTATPENEELVKPAAVEKSTQPK
jgi:hypothetical protein